MTEPTSYPLCIREVLNLKKCLRYIFILSKKFFVSFELKDQQEEEEEEYSLVTIVNRQTGASTHT